MFWAGAFGLFELAMGFDFKKIGQAFDNIENIKITQN